MSSTSTSTYGVGVLGVGVSRAWKSPRDSANGCMRVQVLSDLHLEIERADAPLGEEFYTYDVPVCAEHLALLGDIGWTMHDQLFDWLKKQLKLFKTVFFLSGNHEPYRSTLAESQARLKAFEQEVRVDPSVTGEFVYLNRTRYDVSSTVTIIGCTLWTSLNPEELDILSWSLTDFRRIDGFEPAAYTAQHQADLVWLNTTVQQIAATEPERRVVIFTHHAPTVTGTSDTKFEGQPTNSAFSTELSEEPCWDASVVKLWAFGHTHWNCDFERNGIRVYSNQRGYRQGGEGYDPTKVVTIS